MYWYHDYQGQQVGPITEDEFNALTNQNVIGPGTLIWREGMPSWLEFTQFKSGETGAPAPGDGAVCSQCGRVFSTDRMIRFGDFLVCASCKPAFVQKIKEGVHLDQYQYGGFWIRVGAKIIDSLVMWVVLMAILIPVQDLAESSDEVVIILTTFFSVFFQIVAWTAYNTFFVGKYGATIGKMAVGLRIITSDGGKVSYLRALGRNFAEILSYMILLIGYIMAGFDSEKRTLHDRICDTRVVKKQ